MGGLNPGPDGWIRGTNTYERAGNRWGNNAFVYYSQNTCLYLKTKTRADLFFLFNPSSTMDFVFLDEIE